MLSTILSAIPWTTVFTGLVQLILWVINQCEKKEQLKQEFLTFIAAIDKDVPIKIHDDYQDQLDEIRKKLLENKH